MYKQCPECSGTGYIEELDGDGYRGEVVCGACNGEGSTIDPDSERD